MKFGVREICDVTFKTTAANQRVGNTTFSRAGMPAFFIDTAKTSNLEQASTTVYATGGKGNSRLIAWEGEKTMTFTVEDALISPMGLAVLTGAGLIKNEEKHVHVTLDVTTDASGVAEISYRQLSEELGVNPDTFNICYTANTPIYGIKLDGSGAGIGFIDSISAEGATDGKVPVTSAAPAKVTCAGVTKVTTVKLDFYVILAAGNVTEVTIAPEDFGGYFYVEAQTLFRREDSGKDMAAEIILPKVKVQSGFTFTMAASGDPSTFTFTMDAFPGYTLFDKTNKVMCVMQIVGSDETAEEASTDTTHEHTASNFVEVTADNVGKAVEDVIVTTEDDDEEIGG